MHRAQQPGAAGGLIDTRRRKQTSCNREPDSANWRAVLGPRVSTEGTLCLCPVASARASYGVRAEAACWRTHRLASADSRKEDSCEVGAGGRTWA